MTCRCKHSHIFGSWIRGINLRLSILTAALCVTSALIVILVGCVPKTISWKREQTNRHKKQSWLSSLPRFRSMQPNYNNKKLSLKVRDGKNMMNTMPHPSQQASPRGIEAEASAIIDQLVTAAACVQLSLCISSSQFLSWVCDTPILMCSISFLLDFFIFPINIIFLCQASYCCCNFANFPVLD